MEARLRHGKARFRRSRFDAWLSIRDQGSNQSRTRKTACDLATIVTKVNLVSLRWKRFRPNLCPESTNFECIVRVSAGQAEIDCAERGMCTKYI